MAKKETGGKESTFSQHFKNARKFLQNNNLVEAKDELDRALEIRPNDDKALNLLGMVFFKLEEYPKAVDIFQQLIRRNVDVATLHTNMGLAYIKMNDYEKAIPALKKALEIDPDHTSTHNYLGLAYSKIGEFSLARDEFDKGNSPKMVEKMEQKIKETLSKAPLPADVKSEIHEEEAKILSGQPEELPKEVAKQKAEKAPAEKEKIPEETPQPAPPPEVKAQEVPQEAPVTAPPRVETVPHPGVEIPAVEELARVLQLSIPDGEGIRMLDNRFLILNLKDSVIYARLKNIFSYKGELTFATEFKRFKGKETRALFGVREDPIYKIQGTGRVLLVASSAKPQLFKIEEGHMFISEPKLLAFYGRLEWENGRIQAEGAEDLNLVHFWGSGSVGLNIKNSLISMEIGGGEVFAVDINFLVGWYGRVIPQIKLMDLPDPQGRERRTLIELKGEGVLLLESSIC